MLIETSPLFNTSSKGWGGLTSLKKSGINTLAFCPPINKIDSWACTVTYIVRLSIAINYTLV
jgi:hypothetical protein